MRPILIALLSLLGACATQNPASPDHTARFPSYPAPLFGAFEAACSKPAQTYSRPGPGVRECREFLRPETTAAIILQFDGTTENLPTLVVQVSDRADATGYLVKFESYLNVPQKTGNPIRLVHTSAGYDRQLARLFRLAGGTLVTTPDIQ